MLGLSQLLCSASKMLLHYACFSLPCPDLPKHWLKFSSALKSSITPELHAQGSRSVGRTRCFWREASSWVPMPVCVSTLQNSSKFCFEKIWGWGRKLSFEDREVRWIACSRRKGRNFRENPFRPCGWAWGGNTWEIRGFLPTRFLFSSFHGKETTWETDPKLFSST